MSAGFYESRNLNIRYDLPESIWALVPSVFEEMPGWCGYGGGGKGEDGIPYWFSFAESEKCINASVEPSGLQFNAYNIDVEEWENWLAAIKTLATSRLGFRVGELELGEVGYDIEWL
ncbi:hypothetical protein [Aeoliella sp. SH292]|uniref:hypothetical protein n=1 Tax=Aeoliella sp. SH292 TaxID=3454464 RepID=UPI003F961AEB